jgi:hypothetical protein
VGGGEDYVGEWRGLKRAAVSAVQCSARQQYLVPYCTGRCRCRCRLVVVYSRTGRAVRGHPEVGRCDAGDGRYREVRGLE